VIFWSDNKQQGDILKQPPPKKKEKNKHTTPHPYPRKQREGVLYKQCPLKKIFPKK